MTENHSHENIPDPSPPFDEQANQHEDETQEKPEEDALQVQHDLLAASVAEQEPTPKASQLPVSPEQERTWSMLAHLSILLNLISGFGGGVAALIIYLVYQDRSKTVAYHAMQSFIFQVLTWIGAGVLAAVFLISGIGLFFLVVPLLLLIPGFLLLLVMPASLIYGIVGAVQVNEGKDFRYWLVGDWVRGILEPKAKA